MYSKGGRSCTYKTGRKARKTKVITSSIHTVSSKGIHKTKRYKVWCQKHKMLKWVGDSKNEDLL